jgi:CHAD domain-containing protein
MRELPLTPAPTVRQAASLILAAQSREFVRHEKRARKGEPEAVHQMRVTTRRLRALLRVFKPVLAPPRRIRSGLPWIARRLGRVRDHDVILELLEKRHLPALRGAEGRRLEAVVAALKDKRFGALEKLDRCLRRGRYARLRRALQDTAARPGFRGPEDEPAARFLGGAIEELAARLGEHEAMKLDAPGAESLHALRIEFKRIRYLLDFHAETSGLAYDAERKLARQIQDCLGETHDHDLLLGWLEAGEDLFTGPWLELPGRLAADRQKLFRRFLRLRGRWLQRTTPRAAMAPIEEPRFVSLEPAPVTLRLIKSPKQVASTMIA